MRDTKRANRLTDVRLALPLREDEISTLRDIRDSGNTNDIRAVILAILDTIPNNEWVNEMLSSGSTNYGMAIRDVSNSVYAAKTIKAMPVIETETYTMFNSMGSGSLTTTTPNYEYDDFIMLTLYVLNAYTDGDTVATGLVNNVDGSLHQFTKIISGLASNDYTRRKHALDWIIDKAGSRAISQSLSKTLERNANPEKLYGVSKAAWGYMGLIGLTLVTAGGIYAYKTDETFRKQVDAELVEKRQALYDLLNQVSEPNIKHFFSTVRRSVDEYLHDNDITVPTYVTTMVDSIELSLTGLTGRLLSKVKDVVADHNGMRTQPPTKEPTPQISK